MSHLSFQPAFDVFHTAFRFLRLRRLLSDSEWHYDQLRIADFYLQFFFRLEAVRLSPKNRGMKRLARDKASGRYEVQPSDQSIFLRMQPIQLAAASTLAAAGFFDQDKLKAGRVVETERTEPTELAARIDHANEIESPQMEAILSLVEDYALMGPDGLKARTGLIEYRYDAI